MKFSMNFKCNINVEKPELLKKALDESAYYAVELIKDQARFYVPVDMGTLKDSIETKKITGGYSVGPNTEYDVYVEFGTGMHATIGPKHYIYPVRAKFMTWINKAGERIFAKRTRGIRAQPYMRPALDFARRPVSNYLTAHVMAALRKAGPMREMSKV
jgi:hypothetical protein